MRGKKYIHTLMNWGKKRFVSFLLASTMLTGGAVSVSSAHANDNPTPANTAGASFLFNQAAEKNLRLIPVDSTFYPKRFDEFFPKVYTYTSQNEDLVDSTVKPLWDNMQTLKNSNTIIGPALAKLSEKQNILYCYSPLFGAYGNWMSEEGIVRIDNIWSNLPKSFQLTVQTHETMHGLQHFNGLIRPDSCQSMKDAQYLQLSYEAAAMVGGYLMAIELAEDSIRTPWIELAAIDTLRAQQILHTWDSLKATGLPYAQALSKTGEISFIQQFSQQWWLDSYNAGRLIGFSRKIYEGKIGPITDAPPTLSDIRRTGYISPDFNFTSGIDSLPGNLFGTNNRMRAAFDRAELWRIRETSGEDSKLYKKTYKRMKKGKNPYLEVDFKKVYERYTRSFFVNILDLLDREARILSLTNNNDKSVQGSPKLQKPPALK